MRKPYFRRERKAWYVRTNGGRSQVRLHEDESEAYRIWQEMCNASGAENPTALFLTLAEEFLDRVDGTIDASTYGQYAFYLARFCNDHQRLQARQIKPFHITRWLDANPSWGQASRRAAITSIKRCMNWGVSEGLIPSNPIQSVKRPPAPRREVIISDEDYRRLISSSDDSGQRRDRAFRQVLIALRHSGARPGMIAAVRAEFVTSDGGAWVMPDHKTKGKTNQPLIIYLSPCLETLTKILAARHPSGHLFRNSKGEPWTTNAIRCRMRRMRDKLNLPDGTVAYSFRHTFATQAMAKVKNPSLVAELLGHQDVKMIQQFYGHLGEVSEHLRKAVADVQSRKRS